MLIYIDVKNESQKLTITSVAWFSHAFLRKVKSKHTKEI